MGVLKKRKRRGRAIKITVFVCSVVVVIAALSVYSFNRAAAEIAELAIASACSRAVGAASAELAEGGQPVEVGEGSLTVNSAVLNATINNVSILAESYFNKIVEERIAVPVAALLGFALPCGVAAEVTLSTNFVADCSSEWQLSTLGANGYLYLLNIKINCSIRYGCFLNAKTVNHTYQTPLAQIIVKGDMPKVYFK